MDRINDIRVFLDAATLGSFSAAGRRHGLSPAAASACIQRIEAALGARLFERSTRRLRLTHAGLIYRDYCQQALDLMEEGAQAVQAGQQQVAGAVRISAPSDLGRNLLLRMLTDFRAENPGVRFSLHLSDSTAHLIDDDIDIAIRFGRLPDSAMVARPLAENCRIVCAAPELVARLGCPEHPDDLTALPCLVLTTANGPMHEWRYREHGLARSVRLSRYQQSNDGEIIRKWALFGEGFAYKSQLDVADDLREGRLVTVLDAFFVEPAPLSVLYHSNRFLPPRVRLLIEYLQARFTALTATATTLDA
ncbi:MAG: LysR family transcriptional regulator [Rhodocyclaceae bacterium]